MDIWIVLIEDRHADVEALPFSSWERAVEHALTLGAQSDGARPVELMDGMRRDGWVLYIPYGSEGDKIRVVKRAMGGEPASAPQIPRTIYRECGCVVRNGNLRFCCDSLPGYPHDLANCTASPAQRDAMADHDEMFHSPA